MHSRYDDKHDPYTCAQCSAHLGLSGVIILLVGGHRVPEHRIWQEFQDIVQDYPGFPLPYTFRWTRLENEKEG